MVQIEKINELVVYSVSEAAIADMRSRYLPLVVKDLTDKAGYEACKKARIEVKGYRVAVDKQRKDFKKDAIEYGRMVEAKANSIIGPLEEIEAHLQAQQDIVDKEAERQAAEVTRKMSERLNYRIAEVQKWNAPYSFDELKVMDDEDFSAFISFARDKYFADQKVREGESARLAKLEADKKEADAKIAAQAEENRKLQQAIIRKQQAEIDEKNREERERKQKELDEKAEREDRELQARIKIANEKLFEEIKKEFPTIELAWAEIANLRMSYGNVI